MEENIKRLNELLGMFDVAYAHISYLRREAEKSLYEIIQKHSELAFAPKDEDEECFLECSTKEGNVIGGLRGLKLINKSTKAEQLMAIANIGEQDEQLAEFPLYTFTNGDVYMIANYVAELLR